MTPLLQHAPYVEMRLPVLVEKLAPSAGVVAPHLAGALERAPADASDVGDRWPAMIEHLAAHGAFVRGDPPPMLSRVLLDFVLPGCGDVRAIGWTLWRRTREVAIASADGRLAAPRGFGVVFESMPEAARHVIEAMLRGD